jgi:hypothetical protein
MGKHLPFG